MPVDSKAPRDVMLHFNGEAALTGPEIACCGCRFPQTVTSWHAGPGPHYREHRTWPQPPVVWSSYV